MDIETERRGEDELKTMLVRDIAGNVYIVILKNGEVSEVALPSSEEEKEYQFVVVSDPAIKSVMQTADLDLAQEIADRICHSELVRLGYDNPSVPFVSVSMVAL